MVSRIKYLRFNTEATVRDFFAKKSYAITVRT